MWAPSRGSLSVLEPRKVLVQDATSSRILSARPQSPQVTLSPGRALVSVVAAQCGQKTSMTSFRRAPTVDSPGRSLARRASATARRVSRAEPTTSTRVPIVAAASTASTFASALPSASSCAGTKSGESSHTCRSAQTGWAASPKATRWTRPVSSMAGAALTGAPVPVSSSRRTAVHLRCRRVSALLGASTSTVGSAVLGGHPGRSTIDRAERLRAPISERPAAASWHPARSGASPLGWKRGGCGEACPARPNRHHPGQDPIRRRHRRTSRAWSRRVARCHHSFLTPVLRAIHGCPPLPPLGAARQPGRARWTAGRQPSAEVVDDEAGEDEEGDPPDEDEGDRVRAAAEQLAAITAREEGALTAGMGRRAGLGRSHGGIDLRAALNRARHVGLPCDVRPR